MFSKTVTYRGMMFTGVPNMVWVFGYFRASWTLRVDLVADFVCRLLKHMEQRKGAQGDRGVATAKTGTCRCSPWIDPENFNPGYLHARHAPACRSAATSRNGSTPRTTGRRRTSCPRSTSTTRPSFTGEIDRFPLSRRRRGERGGSEHKAYSSIQRSCW